VSSPGQAHPETLSAGIPLKANDIQHVVNQNKALMAQINHGRGGIGPLNSSGVPAFLSFIPPLPSDPKPSAEAMEHHKQMVAHQQARANLQRQSEFAQADMIRDGRQDTQAMLLAERNDGESQRTQPPNDSGSIEWLASQANPNPPFFPTEWRYPMDPLLVRSLMQSQANMQGSHPQTHPPADHQMRGRQYPPEGLSSNSSRAPVVQSGGHLLHDDLQRGVQGGTQKTSEKVSNAEKLKQMIERKKREQLEKKTAENKVGQTD
jgi:hypothetical protein